MGRGNEQGEEPEIVVTAFSPRYAAAVRRLLAIEGGYVNDPVDRGGATKFGISLRFLQAEGAIDLDEDGIADFDLDMGGDLDAADIRKLTRGDAVYLYHRCFWRRLDAERFDPPIGEMLFDQAVNGGLKAARKLLQRAVNACAAHIKGAERLKIDGAIGPRTRLALSAVLDHPGLGMRALVEAYREAARARYRAIAAARPSQNRFLKGWLARADQLGRM